MKRVHFRQDIFVTKHFTTYYFKGIVLLNIPFYIWAYIHSTLI